MPEAALRCNLVAFSCLFPAVGLAVTGKPYPFFDNHK